MLINLKTEFRYGFDHPEANGRYLTIGRWLMFEPMNFTVEHGWNTSPHNHKYPFEDEDVLAWFPTISADLVDCIPPVYECNECGHHFIEFDEKVEHYIDNHGGEDIDYEETVKCCPKCKGTDWKEWGV